MSIKVGIKVSPLTVLRAGIPNYLHNLLKAFAKASDDFRFFLYTNRELPKDLQLPERFITEKVTFPSSRLQLWYHIGLSLKMSRDGIDLFHDPVYPLPLFSGINGVVTVHDLSNYTNPSWHTFGAAMGGRLLPLYLSRAKRIIAVSHFTAGEIARHFPEQKDKVRVIHNGVSDHFTKVENEVSLNGVRERYGLPSEFFLFLGTLEPRKNLIALLKAFAEYGHEIPYSLVIAGGTGWKYKELLKAVSNHPLRERIHLTGFVESADVPALLTLAKFLAYPSILEGFGLPVLEAMACGTPVLTSNVTSMPEIARDAAVYVNPSSVESIGDGLKTISSDSELREELSKLGLARASTFSWRKCAEETLKVYREAAIEGVV